eukprot:Polyplicarium_translucidae@DN3311_c1_g1_i1.p6
MLTVFLTGFWAIVIGLALFNVIRRRYRRRTTAGVPPPAEDSRAPSLVNPPPRRWVSLSLDELVFERDRASGKLVLVESATAPLLALCEAAELFIVAQVESDDDEKDIMATLESCGAFLAGLQKHRVMFGSTAAGRVSMVRQLQPFAHLEGNPAAVAQLKDKVSNVVRVHRESAADTTEAFTLSVRSTDLTLLR